MLLLGPVLPKKHFQLFPIEIKSPPATTGGDSRVENFRNYSGILLIQIIDVEICCGCLNFVGLEVCEKSGLKVNLLLLNMVHLFW